MLSIVMLSVVMPSVVMLSVVMPSVVVLNVVILSVVEPFKHETKARATAFVTDKFFKSSLINTLAYYVNL
jgi:hypothetical protein